MSPDGRFIAFSSDATNLVPGDTNGFADVFVRDRLLGTTERVSVSSDGTQGNEHSAWYPWSLAISGDGCVVAFESKATNLVPGVGNGYDWHIFVRDRCMGRTEAVSVSSTGQQANGHSFQPSISADGQFVAFDSGASNLVPDDTNYHWDVFVRNRLTNTTELISISTTGEQGNDDSDSAKISADGSCVAFNSGATNLVPGYMKLCDCQGMPCSCGDVFVRDRLLGTTQLVSVSTSGEQGNDASTWTPPSISADGRFVAFQSLASNLDQRDTTNPDHWDIFVRDRENGTTEMVSVDSCGRQGDFPWNLSLRPSISADGRFVAFASMSDFVPENPFGDLDGYQVFVRDMDHGITECVSLAIPPPETGNDISWDPVISADGRFVAFWSFADNLVPDDTNAVADVFVRDRGALLPPGLLIDGCATCTNSTAVTLSTKCRDCAQVRFRNHPGDWTVWEPCAATRAWTIPPGDGPKRVYVQGRDASMNESSELAWQIVLDTTPPRQPTEFRIKDNYGLTTSPDVTLVPPLCCESTTSDCKRIRLRNDPGEWGPWEESCEPYMPWTLLPGYGLKRVCVQTRDPCMNESAEHCDEILLDPKSPGDVSIAINGDAACAASVNVTLNLFATYRYDYEMRFRNEDGLWSAWEWYPWQAPATKAWTLSPGRGLKAVSFQGRDSQGSQSPVATDTIILPTFDDVGCASTQLPYVEALVRKGVTAGCSATPPLYCPYASVTRAQMAKFLCLAAGKTELFPPTPTFADVQPGPWYYGWVERLADPASWPGGIPPTSGCACPPGYPQGARCYCPNDPVTREQMAKFLCLATSHAAMPSCSGTFADVASGGWACPWIERLADPTSWGGTAPTSGCACPPGYPGGAKCYCPKENCTRAQMAKFLVLAFGISL
jgi:Tol biopolymer transport system component